MKSIRGVFFFMNDSCGEINTLLKTQKNTKSNVLKERVIATQQKEEETEDTSCREKILSQDFRDFIHDIQHKFFDNRTKGSCSCILLHRLFRNCT